MCKCVCISVYLLWFYRAHSLLHMQYSTRVVHNFGYWKHSIARSNKVYNFLPLKVFLRFFFVSWIGNSHGTRCKYVSCTNNRSRMFFFLSPVRVYHTVGDTYWIFAGHFFVLAHLRKCILLCNSKPWQNKKKSPSTKTAATALHFFRMSYLYSVCHRKILCSVFVVRFFGDFHFFVLIFNFSSFFIHFFYFLSFFAPINQMTHFIMTFFVFEKKIVHLLANCMYNSVHYCNCGKSILFKVYLRSL